MRHGETEGRRGGEMEERRGGVVVRVGLGLFGLVGLLGLYVLLCRVPIRVVERHVDVVTGSLSTTQTTWPLGISSGPELEVSPLHARLEASGIPWRPSWQLLGRTHHHLLGGPRRDSARAPAIYHLLDEYAAIATDDELREFIGVMQRGTDEERERAVEGAAKRVLR